MFTDDELSDDLFLGGKIKLLQPRDGYRAGTDPVLLAAACPAMPGQSVLELGCGVGTALVCLRARTEVKIFGVEKLPEYADLAIKNAARNGFEATIETANLTKLPLSLRDETFDHVMINPPFFRDGKKAINAGRASGRQEDTTLAEWVDQALRRIKPKGYLTLIHLTDRLSDIITLLNNRAGSVEIKPLSARNKHLPKRVILRARKGSKGRTILHNSLVLHRGSDHLEDQDSFTEKAKAVLREGHSLKF